MSTPEVIFLDAVGTLFGVRGHMGQVYGRIAQKFGVTADNAALNRAFFNSFRSAPPMAFPGVSALDIPQREYEWWKAIALYTFKQTNTLEQFTDFEGFFAELYRHFATADPWELYPDTGIALERWQAQGISLGIISNFDSRLYSVLDALNLGHFFSSITISTEVGAAKPSPQIFQAALQKHNCPAASVWYVGDSRREDYLGAKQFGFKSVLIQRPVG